MNLLDKSKRPMIVGVGGFTSEVGKTTLLCDLLRIFPGWEAIKTTRGHYRSCGKDPQACCVSHLLEDVPIVRSGRELTYAPQKDTGRYWDSGAANVHWVIATDDQVEEGIKKALGRVEAKGVFVEGNSFSKFIQPDYFVMVARPNDVTIKTTARGALGRVSAFYVSGDAKVADKALLRAFLEKSNLRVIAGQPEIFVRSEMIKLVDSIREIKASETAQVQANLRSQVRILSVP